QLVCGKMRQTKQKERRPVGRPRVSQPGRRRTIGFRMPAELFEKINAAAERNGRPLSHECEMLVEFAMRDRRDLEQLLSLVYGSQVGHVLNHAGQIMQALAPFCVNASSQPTVGWGDWLTNAYARDTMLRAAIAYFERMLPTPEQLAAHAP